MTTEAPKTERRILFVDDHQDTCEMVQFLFRTADIAVDVALSFTEGCHKAQTHRYDLILLDYRFADGDGDELCRCIRQFDEQIPILFYSAEAHKEKIQQALAAGAQDYLLKPEDTENLLSRVQAHLD
jgi:two-component system, sensor histidine kinase and response regulator